MTTADLLDRVDPWDDERDTLLVCRGVYEVTPEIRTFAFEAVEPRLFMFLAGQYFTFDVEIDGVSSARSYTISSSPTRPHLLTITVKREERGVVSTWLHDNMREGVEISAIGPLGSFTMPKGATKFLFLGGGVGITPLLSMVRAIYDLGSPVNVHMVHNVRSPAHILYASELQFIASAALNVTVDVMCEEVSEGLEWNGLTGRLDLGFFAAIPDLRAREVFVCGPRPYMDTCVRLLTEAGIPDAQIHLESFRFDEAKAGGAGASTKMTLPTIMTDPLVGATHLVTLMRSGRVVEVRDDEYLLDAIRRAGGNAVSSCGLGMCGTCKVMMASGDVSMKHAGGIRPREIEQGKILLCCAAPRSDVTLDL